MSATPTTNTLALEHIPPELKELRQWLLWRREIRDGKFTKVPYQAARPSQKYCDDCRSPVETWVSWFDGAVLCEDCARFWDGRTLKKGAAA